jgi:hypothetical protein
MKFITSLFLLIVLHTYTFSQLPSYVPKNGLVGYWLFDGNANDFSGNNNHGVVKGATLAAGRAGVANTAYSFNGNDNTIEVPNSNVFNFDTAFTINLWVKLPASQLNNPVSFVSKYSLSQKSGYIFPYMNEGTIGFGLNLTTEKGTIENAAGQGQFLSSQITSKTSWHQYTAVFSNGNYLLYIDGFLIKTNSDLGTTLVNNTNNLIFGNSTGYNQFAKGLVDEIGLWNRILTENEIIALNGCVAPSATIVSTESTIICPGSSVLLTANSGTNLTYQWYRNDTLIPNATTISYNADKNAAYTVMVKSGPCPTISTPINVTYSLPDNKVYNPFADTIHSCINDVVLDAGAGFTSYLWDDKSINQSLTVKESGAHKVKITYGNNCTANDSTYVNLIVQAKIRANDTTICYKDQLLLTNEPAYKKVRYLKYNVYNSYFNYFGVMEVELYVRGVNIAKNKKIYSNAGWSTELANDGLSKTGWGSSSNHFFQVGINTPHTLILDLEKIYDIDSMKIILAKSGEYLDVKVLLSADSVSWTEIFSKRVSQWEDIIPTVNKGFSYKWFKNDNLISSETNRILQAKTPGVYKLEISKNNCTSTSQSVTVKYDNPPTEDGEFDVFQDSIIACGKEVVLDIGKGYKSYSWSDGTKTQARTIANSGKYNVIVEYGTFGCKAKDSVFVDLFKSVLNQKDTTICLGSNLQLANKNKKLNPSIRYVKMAVTSSSSEQLVWHIDVVSNGTNVSSNKSISSNRGSFIDELVRGDAYMGWYTPGSPSSVNDPSIFILDLGKVYEFEDKINTLSLQLMSTLNYNIYVSTDNIHWIKIISENQASGSKTYNLDELDILELTQNYQWYKNNMPIPSANLSSYDVKESGIYKLQATKGTCSLFSESVKIEVEKPDSNFTSFNPLKDSIVVCGNDSLVLDGGPGFKSYNWNDSLFNGAQQLKVFKSGYFSVSVEYGTNGCKLSDFTNVKMYPNLKIISPSTNSTSDSLLFCANGFGLMLQDYYLNASNTNINWYNNGNYLNTNIGTFVSNTGEFHAELNMSGCKLVSDSKIVYSDNQYYLNNLKDTVVCSSQNQLTFDPGKYDSYSWVIDKKTPISTRVLSVGNSSNVYYELTKHGCTKSGNFQVIYVKPIMNTKSINICQNEYAHFFDVNGSNNINYSLFDMNNQVVYSPGGTTSSNQGDWYVTKPGSYFALANLGACSVKSDTVSVVVNALPSNQLLYSRPLIVCNGNTLPIQISTTSGNKYNWSTGQNTSSISVVNAGSYSVNISDSNNCQVTASFKIAKAVLPSINLCMVTTENNKNKVIWNNAFQNYATLSKIRVYKQNSTTSQYDIIHVQGVNELSEFVDTTSEPSIKQARYRIALVDSCGNEKQSTYHNTILLTSNLGVNNTVNLLWNKYEGFEYANFEIWRSEDGVNFKFLNSVSNTSTSFIDNNPPANCFYQVRITNPNECVSSKRGAYKTVSSNVVDKTGSIMKVDENQSINITVYPNPSNGKFYITSEYENCEAVIKDLNGKSVYKIDLTNKINEIDLSHILSEGVYLLDLSNKTNNALYTTKLVVLD